MRRYIAAASLLALALATAGCGKVFGGGAGDEAFGQRVRAYLLSHPEVLKETEDAYFAKQESDKVEHARPLIEKHRAEIFADARDPFVGPKDAKVTVVQFFDYRCPHCKAEAAPGTLALIKAHPDVKFVFKEFPIFGKPSQMAARAALSVWRGKPQNYLGFYSAMMNDNDLDERINDPAGVAKMKASVDNLVRATGLDPAAADKQGDSPEVAAQLSDVQRLAAEIGIDGTPGFIIGDTLISGARMEEVDKLIAKAKGG